MTAFCMKQRVLESSGCFDALGLALEMAIEDQHVAGRTKRSIPNLNNAALREARAAAIEEEEEAFLASCGNPAPTPADHQAHAAGLLAASRRAEFVSIRLAAVLETLGVGR